MRFVDDEEDGAALTGQFGERGAQLREEAGEAESGLGLEGEQDLVVESGGGQVRIGEVDAIEENRFAPRSLEDLNEVRLGTRNIRFATRVCRHCDARFSCASYRQYAWQAGPRGVAESQMRQLYLDSLTDVEQEQWRTAGLDAAPDGDGLRMDY